MILDEYNIEAYLLDFSEGKLNAKEQQEVLNFLRKHREITLHPYEELPILKRYPSETYPAKADLYSTSMERKSELEETLLIGLVHGDLDVQDRELLEVDLKQNNELQKRLNLYRECIISPDLQVVHPNIKNLKKKPLSKTIFPYLRWAAIAAFVFLSIYFAPQIVSTVKNWGTTPSVVYESRKMEPLKFTDSEVEQQIEEVRRSALFAKLIDPNFVFTPVAVEIESKEDTAPKEEPTIVENKAAKASNNPPAKKPIEKTSTETKTVANKAKAKPRNRASSSSLPSKRYQPLAPLESIDAIVDGSDKTNYIALPEIEITGFQNKPEEESSQPTNRLFRNGLLNAADKVGGKRIRYEKRKDGSYKLVMDLPLISVERTINE